MSAKHCTLFALVGVFATACASTQAGRVAPASPDRAACDRQDGAACTREARRLSGPAAAAPADLELAFHLYERACGLGSDDGCNGLALLYATGRGVAKDPVKARAVVRASCDRGAPGGCATLGGDLLDGSGGPRDEKAARALCFEGPAAARALWCALLALDIDQERATGGRDLILQAYQRACAPGIDIGCVRLAEALFRFGRRDEGLALDRRLCAAGNRGACGDLDQFVVLTSMEERHGGPPGTALGPLHLRAPDGTLSYDPPSDTWGTAVPTHEGGAGNTVWRWWRPVAQIEVGLLRVPGSPGGGAAIPNGAALETIARAGATRLSNGAQVDAGPDLLAGKPCAHAWFATGLAGRYDVYVLGTPGAFVTLLVLQHQVFDARLLERAKAGLRVGP